AGLEWVLDDLAIDPEVQSAASAQRVPAINILGVPWTAAADAAIPSESMTQPDRTEQSAGSRTQLTDPLLATGFGGFGVGMLTGNKRRGKNASLTRKLIKPGRPGV